MRIVIDLQSCQNGSRLRGIGRYALALTREMIRQGSGHEFLLLISDRFPGTSAGIFDAFEGLLPKERIIPFAGLDKTASADPANAWRCRVAELVRADVIERLQPDVVLVPSPIEGMWDNVVTSIEPAPYLNVATVHDLIPLTLPEQHLAVPGEREAYLRKVEGLRNADLILSPSRFVRDEIVRELGIPASRIAVTYEGAEDKFSPADLSPDRRSALLARFGISRPFVMNSSPLEYRKNLEGMIASFGLLPPHIRDGHQLVIVGKMDAHALDYLTRLAKAEGLPKDALILTGRVSDADLIDLYRACALFVFPSISEGFGLPVLEAMQCGAIAIGSDGSSIPEVIGSQEALFDPTEPSAIADAMARALTDEQWRARVSAEQQAHRAQLNWPAAARATIEAIERAEAVRDKPSRGSPKRRAVPRLALVHAAHPPGSRSAGYVDALLEALSPHYAITPVCIGEGQRPFWRDSLFGTKDAAWLREQAADLDRILYVGCFADIQRIADLVRDHAGAILTLDDCAEPEGNPYDLSERQRRNHIQALYVERGWRGLAGSLTDDGAAVASAEQALPGNVYGLLREGSGPSLSGRTATVAILPVSARGFTRTQAREPLGIDDHAPLILAHVRNDDEGAELISAFRTSPVARERNAYVVTLSRELDEGLEPAPALVGGFPGRVQRKGAGEYRFYRAYLAAADAVFVDPRLGEPLRSWYEADARAAGLPLIAECTPTAIDAALSPAGRTEAESKRLMADGRDIAESIEGLYRSNPLDRYAGLLDILPADVRSVRPSADDLAQLARVLAHNEAADRAPCIFLDITGVTSAGRLVRTDMRTVAAIRGTLAVGAKRRIEAIRLEGERFVIAAQAVAPILGIDANAVKDEPVQFRPGDRVVGIDLLDGYSARTLPLHLHLAEGGVEHQALILGDHLDDPEVDSAALIGAFLTIDLPLRAFEAEPDRIEAAIQAGLEPRDLARRLVALRRAGMNLPIYVADSASPIVQDILALEPMAALLSSGNSPVEPVPFGEAEQIDYSVTGHVLGSYSLAIINRAVARTIEEGRPGRVRLCPLETDPITDLSRMPVEERPLMEALAARPGPGSGRQIVISQHYPVYAPPPAPDVRRVALFAHEESCVLPSVAESLNAGFDAVITPSTYVTKALIDSGVRIPVVTTGQPSNALIFRDLERTEARRPFTFLHLSSCFPRKGPDVLLKAWAQAFRIHHSVRLIIKTFPNPHNDIEEQVARLRESQPLLAPIEIVNEDLDHEGMARLYAGADAVVLPTRGEGFNLPALEAMLAHIPLIVTGHGGHLDFCGPREARLVKCRIEPSRSHVRSALSLWAEPDVDDLVAALREYADPANRDMITERAERAYPVAIAASDRAAWLDHMDRVSAQLFDAPARTLPRVAWVTTWEVQCGIAQHSEYLFASLRAEDRARYRVICDLRTEVLEGAEGVRAVWKRGEAAQREMIAAELEAFDADAIVIQHQDGLIRWSELDRIASDPRFNRRVLVLVLHNPRAITFQEEAERASIVRALRLASRLVVHSVSDVNLLASLGLTANVTLLPPGAIPPRGRPAVVPLLPEGPGPLIGCHGFALPHKGLDPLIRAAAALRQRWPNIRLRMVTAEFPDEASRNTIAHLKSLADELGFADRIEWHTDFLPIDTVIDLLAGCDLLVLPYDQSRDSASGAARVCLSSMVPTLTTRVQIFEEMREAFAGVDHNDPTSLHDAIDSLLSDPDARSDVQDRMARWLADFDWSRMMELMDGMIAGLVAQRRMGWN